MRFAVLAAVVSVSFWAPSLARAEARYALVIGSNPGWSQDRPLRYAENDAERVRDVLVSYGGFTSERVTLMRDPSTADLRSALRKLATVATDGSDETLVFVYYSGHADDKHLHLRGQPITHKELQDTLRAMPATIKLGVVDACKSGAVTHKGGGVADEFVVDVAAPRLSGMVLLSSSGADELSQESRALAGSVFTHHLVSGLRGAADEDDDKQVTITEAYHYAYTRTRATTASGAIKQRPAFRYELVGQGELVLTTLTSKSAVAAVVPKGDGTKYVVLDNNEWRVIAEATADKAREIAIALSPGKYKVKKVFPDRLEVGSLAVNAGERADLGKVAFVAQALSVGIAKGDPSMLAPEEKRDWTRAEANRLLSIGQVQASLVMFDQLLRQDASDLGAWRGRGRAMVRLAEAYQRVSDLSREKRALGEALRSDPLLSEDPMFQIWYQRLNELSARETTVRQREFDMKKKISDNPRTTKSFGVGFDLVSGRGIFAITATKVIKRILFPRVAVDVYGPGFDAGISIAPMPSKWSPYLGLGFHASAKKLGIDTRPFEPGKGALAMMGESPYSTDEVWGYHARIEGGAQFVGSSGFTTELGLTMILFNDAEGKRASSLWPVFHFGWIW
ncbi:MAG: caspase domain-containing protein [Kofleriaceae bacterium]